jgi:hypothetical protein
MFLERRTVSRKTPDDGRVEITTAAASRVERLGTALALAGSVLELQLDEWAQRVIVRPAAPA